MKNKEFVMRISSSGDKLIIKVPKKMEKHYKSGDWVIVDSFVRRGR